MIYDEIKPGNLYKWKSKQAGYLFKLDNLRKIQNKITFNEIMLLLDVIEQYKDFSQKFNNIIFKIFFKNDIFIVWFSNAEKIHPKDYFLTYFSKL